MLVENGVAKKNKVLEHGKVMDLHSIRRADWLMYGCIQLVGNVGVRSLYAHTRQTTDFHGGQEISVSEPWVQFLKHLQQEMNLSRWSFSCETRTNLCASAGPSKAPRWVLAYLDGGSTLSDTVMAPAVQPLSH